MKVQIFKHSLDSSTYEFHQIIQFGNIYINIYIISSIRIAVLHWQKVAKQSWRSSTASPFPRAQLAAGPDFQRNPLRKKKGHSVRSLSDNKGSYSPLTRSAKLYEERLRSCFSARLFSLPPPESNHFAGSTPRDILRRRQFTSESCMESLQAELRQKEKKYHRTVLYLI